MIVGTNYPEKQQDSWHLSNGIPLGHNLSSKGVPVSMNSSESYDSPWV